MKARSTLGVLLALVAGCATSATPASAPRASPAPPSAEERAAPVRVGEKAPPFTLARIDGTGSVVVPSGRPMLVMLWGFDWGGAHAMQQLQEVHKRWAPKGLEVVAVSHDEPSEHLGKAATEYHVTYPIARDTARHVVDGYRPERVMSIYLIDRAGVIRFVRSTGKESAPTDEPAVEEAIAALLAAPR